MSGAPLVTVVVPTRDRVGMLLQTLGTVLAQSVPIEIVVVDEGSSDGTSARVAALGDARIRVVRHDVPSGLPQARNAGIAASRGEVVAFVDDDDLWSPDKLERQLEAMDRDGAVWAFGGSLTFSQGPCLERVDRPPTPEQAVARLPYANAVPGGGSNAIVRRHALEVVGGFDVGLRAAEDWEMWIRLARLGPPAVVDGPLVAYRRHPGNMSRKSAGMVSGARVIEERYRHLRGGAGLDWTDLYRWMIRAALAGGDRPEARRLAFVALRMRHQGSLRRAARTLVPVAPRRTVVAAGNSVGWRDRLRPPVVVPWPLNTQAWVREALQKLPAQPSQGRES